MKIATGAAFSGLFAITCLVACGGNDAGTGGAQASGGARASGGASNGGTATSGGAPTGGKQSSSGAPPLLDGGSEADASSGGALPDGSVPQPDAAPSVEAGAPDAAAADGGTRDLLANCSTASVVNGVLTNLHGTSLHGTQRGLTLVNLCVRRLKGMGTSNGWYSGEFENRSGTLQCDPRLSISLDGRAGDSFVSSTPSYTHPTSPRDVTKCLPPGGKAFFGILGNIPEDTKATAPVEYSLEATPGTTQVLHPATPTVSFKAERVSTEYVMTGTVQTGSTGISSGLAVVVATRDPNGLVRSFRVLPLWELAANQARTFTSGASEPNPPAAWLVAVIFSGVSST